MATKEIKVTLKGQYEIPKQGTVFLALFSSRKLLMFPGYYFSLSRFPRLEDSLMEQISFRDFVNVLTVAQLVFTVGESYLM